MICLLIAASVGGFIAFGFHRQARALDMRLREIQETETTPMGEVRYGRVEVAGTVSELSESHVSPLSNTACAWWEVHVEEYTGGKSKSWKDRFRTSSDSRLLVEDATGAVELAVEGAEMRIELVNEVQESGTWSPAEPHQEELLARGNFSPNALLGQKKLRYTERTLVAGQQVYALGQVRPREGDFPLIEVGDSDMYVADSDEESLSLALLSEWTNAELASKFIGAVSGVTFVACILLGLLSLL